MKNILNIVWITVNILILGACGSSNWGVDNNSIPRCSSDARDASFSVKVVSGTVVKALSADTTVRVWHYSNSDKSVCVITGQAAITGEK